MTMHVKKIHITRLFATILYDQIDSVLPMLRPSIIGNSQHHQSLSQQAREGGIHPNKELLQWKMFTLQVQKVQMTPSYI